MNKFSLLVIVFLVSQYSNAQTMTGKVTYNFVSKLVMSIPLEHLAELYISGRQSVFVHSRGNGMNGKVYSVSQPDGTKKEVPFGYFQDSTGSIYFKDLDTKSLVIREIVWMQPYLTTEPVLPTHKWAIDTVQRFIGTFKCQKAITRFRGRNYTAWFAPEIPLSDGPWKLHGLPGLILEAYDDDHEIEFLFVSIDIPSIIKEPVVAPKDGLKVSFDDYKKADDLEFQKMARQSMGQNSERGGQTEVKRTNKNLAEKQYEQ